MGRAGVSPAFAGGMRCVERPFDVLRVGARNLAECLSGNGRDVLKILAGSGLNPLAANVVAIARAEAHLIAELARNRFCHCRHRNSSGDRPRKSAGARGGGIIHPHGYWWGGSSELQSVNIFAHKQTQDQSQALLCAPVSKDSRKTLQNSKAR